MNKPRISIIVAMDKNRGIGNKNNLLFHIPEDAKRVRTLTIGHPLIMGRRTFESLKRRLPNRTHIVITHDPTRLKYLPYEPDAIVSSIKEGIEAAKKFPGSDEIFIFGGGQVYHESLKQDLVDRLYLTLVNREYDEYDTFFPDYSQFTKVIEEEKKESDDGYHYTFFTLEK